MIHQMPIAGPAAVAILLCAITVTAAAPPDEPAPPTPRISITASGQPESSALRIARDSREVHGRLVSHRLDIDCVDAPPRTARRRLASALGLNLIDHFPRAEEVPIRIDASLRDVTGIDALETILGFSFTSGRPTWQVREGILEVGPRRILATRTMPVTRVIDVTDLLLEPPYFVPPDSIRMGMGLGDPDSESKTLRKSPREIGAELVRSIVDAVEPDAWSPLTDEDRISGLPDPIDPRDPLGGRNLDPRKIDPITGSRAPIFVKGRWATIRLQGNRLVVRAPAFVMRGITGLPSPKSAPRR
jgi:hypothetical protein